MAKDLIIGTAGHIDHGKTTLIKALTGKDTDRLDEEQKRGISIDIGFSKLSLANNIDVGIIDVPGHEKFIKNMLAGAGGVDLALLVIAADEGFMAQTREHMDILNMLNVKEGIIVISKTDLVDDEWLELVIEDVKEQVNNTFLANAPVVKVSPVNNTGLDKLKEEIEKKVKNIPDKKTEGNVYMPIDRVFIIQGHGTIVTGTLMAGKINKEDQLMIYPDQLGTRVRSIQVHGKQVEEALPGQRVGINLAGIDKADIKRGDVLATTESLEKTRLFNASLQVIPSLAFVVEHGDRIRFHLGAREVMGRIYMIDRKELASAEKGFVQFKLEEDIVANFKERFVIRRYSPMETIGGGTILDTKPVYHKKHTENIIEILQTFAGGDDLEIIATHLKLADKKALNLDDLTKKCGLSEKHLLDKLRILENRGYILSLNTGTKSSWIHNDIFTKLKKEIINYIKNYHNKYHLRPGVAKSEIKVQLSMKLDNNEYNRVIEKLVAEEEIVVKGSLLSLAGFNVRYKPDEKEIRDKILKEYNDDRFNPSTHDEIIEEYASEELTEEIFSSLVNQGIIEQIKQGIYFHKDALLEAEKLLKDFLSEHGEIELGQYRDILDSSRKYTLPLLEYFDRKGVTVRKGDKRVLA